MAAMAVVQLGLAISSLPSMADLGQEFQGQGFAWVVLARKGFIFSASYG